MLPIHDRSGELRGFTLMELLVALTVGALVLLMAHRVTASVVDGVRAAEAAQVEADRRANAARLLGTWIGNADVRPGVGEPFRGEPHRLALPTWWEDAHGWPKRTTLSLAVEAQSLVGYWPPVGRVPLRDGVAALEIDYLLARGASERWVRTWISEASMPEAVRLRIRETGGAVDTLLLVIGGRG